MHMFTKVLMGTLALTLIIPTIQVGVAEAQVQAWENDHSLHVAILQDKVAEARFEAAKAVLVRTQEVVWHDGWKASFDPTFRKAFHKAVKGLTYETPEYTRAWDSLPGVAAHRDANYRAGVAYNHALDLCRKAGGECYRPW